MQIKISTRHGHLSEASQEKIEAKLEKLTRIFDRLTSIEITIDLEHDETPEVHLEVSAEHKHDFVAKDRSESLSGSIDSVIHKMEQQLRKYKEKVVERSRDAERKKQDFPEAVDAEQE